jgi:hypothetical protein
MVLRWKGSWLEKEKGNLIGTITGTMAGNQAAGYD